LLTAEAKKLLTTDHPGTTLIITIGNNLRSDDGVGPFIAQNSSKLKTGLVLLNAGEKPENIIDEAVEKKPSRVIIIDAANFGGTVGEVKVIDSEHIPNTTLSTHTFPLKVIAKLLETDCQAPVHFLGIQPQSVELGENLSAEVKAAANEIINLIGGGK